MYIEISGLSEQEYQVMVAHITSLLTGLGIDTEKAFGFIDEGCKFYCSIRV